MNSKLATISAKKAKRDLYWVLTSNPLLIENPTFSIPARLNTQEINRFFDCPDFDNKLETHMSGLKSHFLGAYFEHLWLFYLQESERYELIAHNLQVTFGGRTIGEFDFLVYDRKTKENVHQELAIKFYLGHISAGKTQWIGPQTIDRLDLKMDKLIHHQTQLGLTEPGQEALNKIGIEKAGSQIHMLGYLFYPKSANTLSFPLYINPKHLQGLWFRASEFENWIAIEADREDQWYCLEKLNWIDQEEHTADLKEVDPLATAASYSIKTNRPQLLMRVNESSSQKIFITPDTWPN